MLINELSKRTGITAHTIRFYEKSGLIKGVRDENVKSNNYFHYDEETVEIGNEDNIGQKATNDYPYFFLDDNFFSHLKLCALTQFNKNNLFFNNFAM